jgi:nitrogen regulatory protein PII
MKAVFIAYNQALTEKIDEILDELLIRGMTQWTEVKGRGTLTGEPHMGTHTWPALNNTILAIVDKEKIEPLLSKLKQLNDEVGDQGLRAFVWDIEKSL